jgi:hypothetical protein
MHLYYYPGEDGKRVYTLKKKDPEGKVRLCARTRERAGASASRGIERGKHLLRRRISALAVAGP